MTNQTASSTSKLFYFQILQDTKLQTKTSLLKVEKPA